MLKIKIIFLIVNAVIFSVSNVMVSYFMISTLRSKKFCFYTANSWFCTLHVVAWPQGKVGLPAWEWCTGHESLNICLQIPLITQTNYWRCIELVCQLCQCILSALVWLKCLLHLIQCLLQVVLNVIRTNPVYVSSILMSLNVTYLPNTWRVGFYTGVFLQEKHFRNSDHKCCFAKL